MHAEQLKLWAEVVAEKMREGATLEELKEELENRDPSLRKVKDYLQTHPILGRGAILQSVEGFAECVRRLGPLVS